MEVLINGNGRWNFGECAIVYPPSPLQLITLPKLLRVGDTSKIFQANLEDFDHLMRMSYIERNLLSNANEDYFWNTLYFIV